MSKQIMINQERAEEIIQQLWNTTDCHRKTHKNEPIVYAILDGSCSDKIYPLLKDSQLRYSCLYEGKLNYELTLAAPYIVRLEKNANFTRELLQLGWGNSWGIFAITYSPSTLISVRRNCRKIAYIHDSRNKKFVFRYYDPRVLRTYLPTCTESEAEKIFGPITEFYFEKENPNQAHRFVLTNVGATDLTSYDLEQYKSINIKSNLLNGLPQFNILHLRDQQMDALKNRAIEKDYQIIKKQFISDFIEDPAKPMIVNNNEVSLDIFLRACLREALTFKLDDQYCIYSFFHMSYLYGWKFWNLDNLEQAKAILKSPRKGEIKIEKLEKLFSSRLLNKMWSV